MWFDVFCVVFGWFACITGVALGGYMVFRTKKEPHESFFKLREPKGKAFVLDDGLNAGTETPPPIPKETAEANQRFVSQFAEKLGSGNE